LPLRARCEQIGTGYFRSALPDAAAVEAQLSYVNGAAALVSRRMIEAAGFMDEGYFLYFEEIDWAERANDAGFRLGYCPEALVYHKVGVTTGTVDGISQSLLPVFYQERSKIRFLRRRHPSILLIAIPLTFKAALGRLLKGHFAAARAYLCGAAEALFEQQAGRCARGR
jgi:GT2 family glycosyltransferase